MDNINSRTNIINNYFNPLVNDYSTKDTLSFLGKDSRYHNLSNRQLNQNQNNYLSSNFKKLKSNDILNNRIVTQNDLKRYHTQKNLKKININNIHNISNKVHYIITPDDYNVTFAKKSNMYTNNNGKVNNININNFKNFDINNNTIVKKINNNYNPKFYSSNNNNVLINNNNILIDNNNIIITKKKSNNMIKYNNNLNLNSTLPINTLKKNYFGTEILSTEQKLSLNQKINKKKIINNIILNSEDKTQKKDFKPNLVSMTDYKIKNRNQRNDLSFDYGVINREKKFKFFKNKNPIKNNLNNYNILSNNLSERKNKFYDINKNIDDNNNDIDDKDLDEIVDELDLFFNNEKQNKTVILNEKGFSDDSLSDIADDIVKNFQEFETENDNDNINIPSAFNPELDGVTSSTTDAPYNNNDYQGQEFGQQRNNIIYETKSTVKPTIVNNFFISSNSGEQNKNNNNLNKDINYILFVVNENNNSNNIIIK